MVMKTLLLGLLGLAISHNLLAQKSALYLRRYISERVNGQMVVMKDSIYAFTGGKYFEMGISKRGKAHDYIARKELEYTQNRIDYIDLLNENRKNLEFATVSDFLSFMDEKGYLNIMQVLTEYGLDYEFVKMH